MVYYGTLPPIPLSRPTWDVHGQGGWVGGGKIVPKKFEFCQYQVSTLGTRVDAKKNIILTFI